MRESDRSMERRKDTQRGNVGSTTGSCSFAFLFFLPTENMSIWAEESHQKTNCKKANIENAFFLINYGRIDIELWISGSKQKHVQDV